MDFGKQIRQIRKDAKLTQEQKETETEKSKARKKVVSSNL